MALVGDQRRVLAYGTPLRTARVFHELGCTSYCIVFYSIVLYCIVLYPCLELINRCLNKLDTGHAPQSGV